MGLTMKVIVDLCVVPIGVGVHLAPYIAAIEACHQAVHAMGCPRAPACRPCSDASPAEQVQTGLSCRGGVGSRVPTAKASATSRAEAHRQAFIPPSRNRPPDSRVPTRRPAALAM